MDNVDNAYEEYLASSLLNEAIDMIKNGYPLDSYMRDRLTSCDIDPDALEEEFSNG